MHDDPESIPESGDRERTIEELRQLVRNFVAERNWQRFHDPKNLASAIVVEAAELIEHFQWLTNAESRRFCGHTKPNDPVAEELADVLAYVLALANSLDIDLWASLSAKMKKNASKYPPNSVS